MSIRPIQQRLFSPPREPVIGLGGKNQSAERSLSFIIMDERGIHARPADRIVRLAKKFNSTITFSNPDREEVKGDLKGVLHVLAGRFQLGDMMQIKAAGEDAEEALAAIAKLFKDDNYGMLSEECEWLSKYE